MKVKLAMRRGTIGHGSLQGREDNRVAHRQLGFIFRKIGTWDVRKEPFGNHSNAKLLGDQEGQLAFVISLGTTRKGGLKGKLSAFNSLGSGDATNNVVPVPLSLVLSG
jgi:hypothetical protein